MFQFQALGDIMKISCFLKPAVAYDPTKLSHQKSLAKFINSDFGKHVHFHLSKLLLIVCSFLIHSLKEYNNFKQADDGYCGKFSH